MTGSKAEYVWRMLSAFIMVVLGLFMITHGLGLVDASWMRPNPQVPAAVFAMIGATLVLAAILLFNTLRPLSPPLVNLAGYAILALALLLMHWMAFWAVGGSCGVETEGIALWSSAALCHGFFRLVVLGLDALLLLVLLASLRRGSKRN
jgi:hypothetical protein